MGVPFFFMVLQGLDFRGFGFRLSGFMGVGVQDDLCNDAQVPYLSFSGTPVF